MIAELRIRDGVYHLLSDGQWSGPDLQVLEVLNMGFDPSRMAGANLPFGVAAARDAARHFGVDATILVRIPGLPEGAIG